jgi:hypothetical protein
MRCTFVLPSYSVLLIKFHVINLTFSNVACCRDSAIVSALHTAEEVNAKSLLLVQASPNQNDANNE